MADKAHIHSSTEAQPNRKCCLSEKYQFTLERFSQSFNRLQLFEKSKCKKLIFRSPNL